ncbi:MAG TPA: transglycosylase domain-containing protein [Candidatus Dormibacteraeota bacterium]
MSLEQGPEARRRRAGLPNGSRAPMRAAGSANPGVGAAQAAARAELRRRRASAYRHLRQPRRRGRVLRVVLILVTVFAAIGAGTVGAVFAGYNAYKSQLPDASTITNMEPQIDTDVYDAAGNLIQVFHNSGYRHIHVDLSGVSPLFKEAIVAVEDHNFYTEGSWDLARLAESGVADITHSSSTVQGGSTITEQLAKISLYGGADPPQSIDYKIKEIVLGNEIQLNFTKNEILEMYINRIFYGNFAVGVGSAAELYFLKPASQLDLAQAAMLAGLPQSPTSYNPLSHPANETVNPLAKNRQKQVLQAMVASHDVTEAQAAAAYAEPLTFHSWTQSNPSLDPDFVSYLEKYLDVHFPQYANPGGYIIHTTLDPVKQNEAYTTVHNEVQQERKAENMNDGALVSLDPRTGDVLAMVGAWNYADPDYGQVNMADTPVPLGSTTKLFTYTAAIASTKFTMTTPLLDDYFTFPIPGTKGYRPPDDDRRTHGVCELKVCLGDSFNIPAVKTEYGTGIDYITNVEMAMGVQSINGDCQPNGNNGAIYNNRPKPDQWAATLGAFTCGIDLIDLADGAATLADLGVQHDPMPVTSIVAQATGQTVWTYNATAAGRQVIPANVAYIMDQITSNDNNRIREFGRNGYLTLNPRRVSAKTGTSDFFVDNLTVGWTPNLTTAVWVGNGRASCLKPQDVHTMQTQLSRGNVVDGLDLVTDPFNPGDLRHYGLKPYNASCGRLNDVVSGYSGAAPIWHTYMEKALKGVPDTWYKMPADVIAVGPPGNDDDNFYIPGTQPGASTNCTYVGPVPLPTQTCTYMGPSAAPPTPPPGTGPSPSPGPTPTPSPGPTGPPH